MGQFDSRTIRHFPPCEIPRQVVGHSTPNARTTLPGVPRSVPGYPDAAKTIPPATTGPAEPNDPPLAATPLTVEKSFTALNDQITVPSALTARRIPSQPPVKITPGIAVAGPACPRRSASTAAFHSTLPVLISSAFKPPLGCCSG